MKAVVAAFNQEKALVGAFSVITILRMELFEALVGGPLRPTEAPAGPVAPHKSGRGQKSLNVSQLVATLNKKCLSLILPIFAKSNDN